VEKIILNINALGANRPNHPSRQERGLRLVIANKEEKLEVLEARRTAPSSRTRSYRRRNSPN
jgi:hypothetical protein